MGQNLTEKLNAVKVGFFLQLEILAKNRIINMLYTNNLLGKGF